MINTETSMVNARELTGAVSLPPLPAVEAVDCQPAVWPGLVETVASDPPVLGPRVEGVPVW